MIARVRRLNKQWRWLAGSGFVLALLLVGSLVATPAMAVDIPGMPHQFYGTVTIDGASAAGSTLEAYVNGAPTSPATTTTIDSNSRYGYSSVFQVPGSTGNVVTFYVGGVQADQTVTFQNGGLTKLNLTVTTGALTITTTSLPNGTAAVAYSQTLAATNGTTPYTWSLYSGSFPNGLSLSSSGVISGTPTTDGTSYFTVQVTDAATDTDTQPLSITIGEDGEGGKLIGASTAGTGKVNPNRFILGRFQATQTGNVNQIRIYSIVSGHVKVAIYADSSGQPGALINANNTSTAVTASQWNNISITSTAVTSGTYYWLAVANDVQGASSYRSAGTGTSRGKDIAYSTFTFSASAGTGFSSYTLERAFAGYGGGGGVPTRLTPAINSVTFSWNAVTDATKYHLQVSTSSGFGTTVEDDATISGTSKQVTGLSGGTYYWRVKAYVDGDWGSWSSIGSVIGQ